MSILGRERAPRRVGRTYAQARAELLRRNPDVTTVNASVGADGVGVVYVSLRATGTGRVAVVSMEYDVE